MKMFLKLKNQDQIKYKMGLEVQSGRRSIIPLSQRSKKFSKLSNKFDFMLTEQSNKKEKQNQLHDSHVQEEKIFQFLRGSKLFPGIQICKNFLPWDIIQEMESTTNGDRLKRHPCHGLPKAVLGKCPQENQRHTLQLDHSIRNMNQVNTFPAVQFNLRGPP